MAPWVWVGDVARDGLAKGRSEGTKTARDIEERWSRESQREKESSREKEGVDGDQDEVLRALDRQGWTSGGCQSAGLITCWLQGTSEQSQWPRSSSVKSNILQMTITPT